jgi:predicted RNase H-like HicB family nuclease
MEKQEYNFRIEYEVDKESKQVVAIIPELNHVSSFGNTFAEAEANVKEAAICYIETLEKERKRIPETLSHTEGTYIKLFGPKLKTAA